MERLRISPELTLLYCRRISSAAAALKPALWAEEEEDACARASTTGPTVPLDTTCVG